MKQSANLLFSSGRIESVKRSHQYLSAFVAFAIGCFLAWLTSREPVVREVLPAPERLEGSAVEALGLELGEAVPGGLLPLVEAVGNETDAGARSSAAVLLEQAYRSSGDELVRAAVLVSLERLGGPYSCTALASIFRLGNEDASQAAMRLSRIDGQDCAAQLKAIIEKEERGGELARSALRALGRTRSRAAAEFCRELCAADYEPAVRREAAEALGRIAEKSSVATLLELLGDQEERLRMAAITALGLIRSEESALGLRSHGGKPGLGPVEARLVEEALGRLEGREPARLK